MNPAVHEYRNEVLEELEKIPSEFLPAFLKVMRAFRESVALPAAEESFRQGWSEAVEGQVQPLSELWEGIDAE